MKVIIAGSREGVYYHHLEEALKLFHYKITEVVSGKAKGADTVGEEWAKKNDIHIEPFPAKWNDLTEFPQKLGRRKDGSVYNILAGLNRNTRMAEYADALIALRLPYHIKSSGTDDMIEKAKKNKLFTIIYICT